MQVGGGCDFKLMPMKMNRIVFAGSVAVSTGFLLVGCARTEFGHTSPYHPGPVAGKAVGLGVGVVAGNAIGAGVGVVEGTAAGLAAPFDTRYHMVRSWKTEVTSDGRTIQVPVDILVDKYGRPVNMPAPTGNSPDAPPTTSTVTPARPIK